MGKAFIFFLTLPFLLLGCSQKKVPLDPSSHTYKLQRPFKVTFLSSEKIEVSRSATTSTFSVKIYLKNDSVKKLVEVFTGLDQETIELNLPDDLSDYSYIVAVAESSEASGNKMSAVDTYKIGEQELINEAKRRLKNRN